MPCCGQCDDLAGLDVAFVLGLDDVEGDGLAGDEPRVAAAADAERAVAERIAHGLDTIGVGQQQAVRAVQVPQHRRERIGLVGEVLIGEHVQNDLGVRGRDEDVPVGLIVAADFGDVHQVAVVADGDLADRARDQQRLDVRLAAGAGGRVAHVADGHRPVQFPQLALVDRVGHQAHPGHAAERLAVGGADSGGLLSAVLLGVESEVGELGGVRVVRDAEEAAVVAYLGHHSQCIPLGIGDGNGFAGGSGGRPGRGH